MSQTSHSEIMNERDAAAFLAVAQATLKKWRATGRGPRFLRLGSAIRYRRADLESYLADCIAA